MKKEIHNKLILALIIPVLYILSLAVFNSTTTENLSGASAATVSKVKDFLNIVFNLPSTWVPSQNWVERNMTRYKDSLHYNGIQIYDDSSSRFGYFDLPLTSTQITNVKNLMSNVESAGLKGAYARTKITWLAEGQRLEYEVSNSGSTTVNNGFCYQNVMDSIYKVDSNRTVLNPKAGIDSAGWLCDSIYENMQHSDFINGNDKEGWFLKPEMRIDTNDFSQDDTTAVIAVVTKNFDGSRIDSTVIKVKNFRDDNGDYNGNYQDIFNFTGELGTFLEVQGRDTVNGLNYGRNALWLESSKIDFKVYWFGLVDVWFDKMTVDDEMGNNLFKGDFNDEIFDEVSHFSNEQKNYSFYCDETVYSQIPCLEYLSNKMHSYNDTSKLSYVISDHLNRYSMKNDSVAYAVFLTKVKPKIFFADPYLIPWEIPDNLNFPGSDQLSASEYNDLIQKTFGDKNSAIDPYENSFIKQVDLARRKIRYLVISKFSI